MRSLADANGNPVFDAQPSPTVVLDREFVIQAANRAYLATSGRTLDDLLGVNVFEAFPDNPEDPGADGVARLQTSLERVLRSERMHNMLIQRYDVLDVVQGHWVQKLWAPVNSPIRADDRVVGIMHRVEDITPVHRTLDEVLEQYGVLVNDEPMTDRQAGDFVAAASSFVASAKDYNDLLEEVTHLRRALVSRSTIDQAKGILMAEQGCSPEAAFNLMNRLSQDTNVRLADVAAALVYKARGPRNPQAPLHES